MIFLCFDIFNRISNKVFISYIIKINIFNQDVLHCQWALTSTTFLLRVGKSALDEYDKYAVCLAILNHGAIGMFSICSHLQ